MRSRRRGGAGLVLGVFLAAMVGLVETGCATEPTGSARLVTNGERPERLSIATPEVFELVMIAVAVAEKDNPNDVRIWRRTPYYDRVVEHFGAYADDKLIARMRFGHDYAKYMSVRENSAAYVFNDAGEIVHGGVYPSFFEPDSFEKYKKDLERFAERSGFRAFYEAESDYYAERRELYRETIGIERMWGWLEDHFPERYDAYRIVFSPLLGQSHSTRRFEDGSFTQCVMFVPGPEAGPETGDDAYDSARRDVLVFTEIDHNYVNPATTANLKAVEKAMRPLRSWNTQTSYRTAFATFNEYMTWSVYLLYAEEAYSRETFERVARLVERTMERDRGFPNFGAFHVAVRRIYLEREEGQSIADLYPEILARVSRRGPFDE